jgi:hypothetical protein
MQAVRSMSMGGAYEEGKESRLQ